jgi:hypothetical protein
MASRPILALAVLPLWLIASALGLVTLWNYSSAPGIAGTPPIRWPTDSRLPRAAGVPTLVMVVHPQCPCSQASMGELAQLMTDAPRSLIADVVFVNPAGFQPSLGA